MAKLSPDYIQFVLSLNTSQAQQEIHKLEKASNELKNENKDLRKSMNDLIASGRRNSEEYRNLEAQYKRNNRAIAENNAKTQELLRTIDTQSKSYKQLSQEAKRLQRELDNTVKALEPERYAELSKQLENVRGRMNELRGSSRNLNESFLSLSKIKTVLVGGFLQLGASVAQSLGEAVGRAKEFVNESMDLAKSADGVIHAFEQLGRADLLAVLREATKGTVSDLQLMTSLVKARDFRVPLDEMGKFLAFAQLKAQQTGQSVDFMVDSIVTGLGRQSLLILDNLGLSAAEIREKIAETGDFMLGVGAIVDQQLQQAGRYISAADQVAAADVKMENAKLKLGRALTWLGDIQVNLKSTLADMVNGVLSSANDRYEEQKAMVMALTTETEPLINRYDELKAKISLTTDEQTELNAIIGKIAQNIPSAISKLGAYGKALDINSEQARRYIATQKQLMLYDNRDAIAESQKRISKYRDRYTRASNILNQGGEYKLSYGSGKQYLDTSTETLARAASDAAQYKALLDREQDRLNELRGENLESLIEDHRKQEEARNSFIKMNRKQLEEWLADERNAQSEYRDMAQSFLATKPGEVIAEPKKSETKSQEKEDITKRLPQYKDTFTVIRSEMETIAATSVDIEQEQARLADYVSGVIMGNSSLMADLFADASEMSVAELQRIIDKTEQLYSYLQGDKNVSREQALGLGLSPKQLKNLEDSPKDIEALSKALKKLKGELSGRSPIQMFEQQVAKSAEKLKKGDMAAGIEGIGNAVANFAPALSEFGEDLGNIFGSDKLSEKIKGIAGALGGMGETAAGVGRIMSGDVLGGAMSAVSGISSMVSAIGSLFGADYSQYENMVAKYETLLDIWDELLEAKRAYIEESYGAEAVKAGEEALNITRNQLEVERKLAEIRLKSGASAGSHSLWYRMWKGSYKWEGQNWQDVAGDVESGLAAAGLGNVSFKQMESFLTMSSGQLRWIKENYAGLWSAMDGDFREHLEKIIEIGDAEKEVIESVKEQLTGISFDEFEDSYMSMLMNLDSSNEDFADNFEKYLQQSILKSVLSNKYKNRIQQLYDTWASFGENGLTTSEVDYLKDLQQELADAMLQEREQLAQVFGWSSGATGGSGQIASRGGGFETMTQDQASELSGRFTALQESGYRLEGLVELILQGNSSSYECATEIRDILYESNGFLSKIEAYTRGLGTMGENLELIKNNTKNL